MSILELNQLIRFLKSSTGGDSVEEAYPRSVVCEHVNFKPLNDIRITYMLKIEHLELFYDCSAKH